MAGVYLKQGDEFIAMREAPYDAENVLQDLVAAHPEMLGEDDAGEGGAAWLLISRRRRSSTSPTGSGAVARPSVHRSSGCADARGGQAQLRWQDPS